MEILSGSQDLEGRISTSGKVFASLIAQKGAKGDIGPQGEIGPQGPVGPQGPQGIQGKSGVVSQAEEPTEEDIYVWVDTDEEGLVYEGETGIPETLYALGADYAEYFEWEDGNPGNEDRRCMFVSIVYGTRKIRKAMAGDDVLGITSIDASVIGNAAHKDKSTYSAVGMMGVMKVKDNGQCIVGEYVMPGDNGIAIPSTNNAGYKVTARYDKNLIEVLLAHDAEMISRIKDEIEAIGGNVPGEVTQETIEELKSLFVNKEELKNYATKEYVDALVGDIERELGGI